MGFKMKAFVSFVGAGCFLYAACSSALISGYIEKARLEAEISIIRPLIVNHKYDINELSNTKVKRI